MGIARNILLWSSKNPFLINRVPKYRIVKIAVKRFMPGERVEDAVQAASALHQEGIISLLTPLGENINNLEEAKEVSGHYIDALDKISSNKLKAEISLKLTQIGLDLSFDQTLENFRSIAEKAKEYNSFVWIDMEESSYTDTTIKFYRTAKKDFSNIGVCLQAYLFRTANDISGLLDLSPSIRLVKGAYKEPKKIAFGKKADVDNNFLELAKTLLKNTQNSGVRVVFGTHDASLIGKIGQAAEEIDLPKNKIEVQMLYGIMNNELRRLKDEGYTTGILISYGDAWFPWYVRRLAERPANVWFVLKNILRR